MGHAWPPGARAASSIAPERLQHWTAVQVTRSSISDHVLHWGADQLQPVGLTLAALGGSAVYLAMLAWGWQHTPYDVWGALVLGPVVVVLTIPMARRLAHDEDDPALVRILLTALVLKLTMSLVRYAFIWKIYEGFGDSTDYHRVGSALARGFRSGDLTTMGEALTSTGFIRVLTGALYTITGPTSIGGFIVFSWLGFGGLYFFYRAFRIGVPDGNRRRFCYLVFFLPSLLYWPSSIGKEAWMSLTLGIAAFGSAKLLRRDRGGLTVAALGLTGAAIVRPHVAMIFLAALAVAYLVRKDGSRSRAVVAKAAALVVFAAGFVLLVGQVEELLRLDSLREQGTDAALQIATVRSEQGGSAFTPVEPTSPTRFGWAVVTVLFRPFPNEVGNLQAMSAALEAIVVAGLCVLALPAGLRALRRVRERPYVVFSIAYVLLFCYAFASIANFGILTRQRVQVLPFVLVLACLAPPRVAEDGRAPTSLVAGRV
jgi:hypothetical protein